MARPLIYQPYREWTLFEVTFRCLQGRFLMKPGEEACRRMLGVIGRGLELYGDQIKLHFAGGTSNHVHLILSSYTAASRSDFKCFVKTNISKELGDLYDWKEHLFGRRCRDIVILDDEALRGRLHYLCAHGIKEGLVSARDGWPGIPWVRAVTEGRPLIGVWYDRTRLYRLCQAWERLPKRERGRRPNLNDVARNIAVHLSPVPFMAEMDSEQRRSEWRQIFEESLLVYPARTESPLGPEALCAQHPHTRPKNSKRSPAPRVHCTVAELSTAWTDAYSLFVEAFQAASELLGRALMEPTFAFAYPMEGIPPVRYRGGDAGDERG